jgi:sugar lactone lactonase YvrE
MAGCQPPGALRAPESSPQPAAVAPESRAVLSGQLRVPAHLIGPDGGTLIGVDAGTLTGPNGGALIAAGGLNYRSLPRGGPRRLAQLDETPVRGARVFLADAQGRPLPDGPTAVTGADGGYRLEGVPTGITHVVVAEVPAEQGRKGSFRTLAVAGGEAAPIDAATTLVAAYITQGSDGPRLPANAPAAFRTAVDATAKKITRDNLPDFTDEAAVRRAVDRLLAEVAELREAFGSLRRELNDKLDKLQETLNELVGKQSPSPGAPSPTAGALSPSPGMTSPPGSTPSPSTPSATPSAVVGVDSPQPSPGATPSFTPTPTAAPSASASPMATAGWRVETVAGNGTPGVGWGTALGEAKFSAPRGLVVTADGAVYIGDVGTRRIAKLSRGGTGDTVSPFAGSGGLEALDGVGTAARFRYPFGLALGAGNTIFVADGFSGRVRRVGVPDATVSTVSDAFATPTAVAAGSDGTLYVGSQDGNRIQRWRTTGLDETWVGSLEAGYADGPAVAARFRGIGDIVADGAGTLYVSDPGNHCIRKVSPAGEVSTLAGRADQAGDASGVGAAARFTKPLGLALAPDGSLYVADVDTHRISRVTSDGHVTPVAGGVTGAYVDGPGPTARFNRPYDVAVGPDGSLYVSEQNNHRIRHVVQVP